MKIPVENFSEHAKSLFLTYGVKAAAALAILVLGLWGSKAVSRLVRRGLEKSKIDPTLTTFLGNLTYVGLMIFVLLATLSQIGIQTTSFLAVLGAAGLAVGLALQGSLSNLASGVLLIFFRPFRAGDEVKVSGMEGKVAEIQIFTTLLKAADGRRIIIPNAKITSDIMIVSPGGPSDKAG